MSNKSIIIIGAGLAGLSAGIYAELNGYQAHIFEHHTKPGGVVATWKRKGYLIDGGIHFLMGHKPGQAVYDLYTELGITGSNKIIDLHTYGVYSDLDSNKNVAVTHDLDKLAQDLKDISQDDAGLIDEMIAAAKAMQGADSFAFGMQKPPELMSLWDKAKEMWGMRKSFKYMTGKYNKPVSDYAKNIKDPFVRDLVLGLFMPEVPVWFVLILLAMLANKQLGLLESGSAGLIESLEKRYLELGGRVSYKSTVEKVLVEDGRAVGIRLVDGTEERADEIVSAADGYSTIYDMLDARYLDKKIEERYKNWKLFQPFVMLNFCLDREFTDEPYLRTVKLDKPLDLGMESVNAFFIRIFNYSDKFSRPGKTVLQIEYESDWDLWNELRQDLPAYKAQKDRVAMLMLELLEKLYSGVTDQVDLTDVATPYTTWRYTRNHRGAFEGFMPTPKAIMTRVDKTLPGLDNFYMAGQWVMPGGGVPPCLFSGRQVIQMICAKDGKEFAI